MHSSELRNGGFSLLEVLVALAILALSLGVIYRAQMNSIASSARAMSIQTAILHAQSLMAESIGPLSDTMALEGGALDGVRWRVAKEIVSLPPLTSGGPEVKVLRTDIKIYGPRGDSQSLFTTFSAP